MLVLWSQHLIIQYEYNGIKFFNHEGLKLSDEFENRIEALILAERDEIPTYTYSNIGTIEYDFNITKSYENYLCSVLDDGLDGIKVLLDCANGAAYEIAPNVLKRMNAEVDCINVLPDGININKECGSTYIDNLTAKNDW